MFIAAQLPEIYAAPPVYESFDYPEATSTIAVGINNSGETVGFFGVCDSEACDQSGFLRKKDGSFVSIDFPGASGTSAYDISDSGEVVGSYFDTTGQHAFLLTKSGEYKTIDYPGLNTCQTVALGVNSRGQIVGYYDLFDGDCDGPDFTFLRETDGTYRTISNPFSDDSINAYSINPLGQIVGNWLDESGSSDSVYPA